MMRALWTILVPGQSWACAMWGLWLAFDVAFAAAGRFHASWFVVDGLLFLLNLASWDYQRRQRAGGAS